MLFQKKCRAAVLSKGKEDVEDPPVVAVAGANPVLTIFAMNDKNRSMWRRDTVYYVSFNTDSKIKEFWVERSIYESLEPGDEGILIYSGSKFISFDKSG